MATVCQATYYLVSNGCPTCSGIDATWVNCSDATTPTACITTHYIVAGTPPVCTICTTIGAEVATCNSTTYHMTCTADTHYVNSANICTSCATFNATWLTCTNETHALTCASGYAINAANLC